MFQPLPIYRCMKQNIAAKQTDAGLPSAGNDAANDVPLGRIN